MSYKDIYLDKNLEAIPAAQFAKAWSYRKEFEVSPEQARDCAELIFEGINYSANVWLNGERIAAGAETFGAFRIFDFDVTGRLKTGQEWAGRSGFPAAAVAISPWVSWIGTRVRRTGTWGSSARSNCISTRP